MKYPPSKYQSAICNWSVDSSGNLVVEAIAGSGKTTTLTMLVELLNGRILLVAFNKSIAIELKERLPNCDVRTYHSLGLFLLTSSIGRVQINNSIDWNIIKTRMGYKEARELSAPIQTLGGLVKNNLTDTDDTTLYDLSYHYGIELNGDAPIIFDTVRYLIQDRLANPKIINFDDMVWLPNVLDLTLSDSYDWVLVDELQDTNKAQSELIGRVANNGSRVVGVGDTYQSIYAFRGANQNAMSEFTNRWNATTLPLSISYRNPKCTVDLINKKFPEIKFEGWEKAKQGKIETITLEHALQIMEEGDMVLCRINADLVSPCFEMIRKGVKATIKGRDIGKNLSSLVKKMKSDNDISVMLARLQEYMDDEVGKLIKSDREMSAQSLIDKVETVFAIADGCHSVYELYKKIEDLFSDERTALTFSSIHKAKGLESDRVFILRPDLLPHPRAKKSWEVSQERNLEYVALTRTKNETYIVVDKVKDTTYQSSYIA